MMTLHRTPKLPLLDHLDAHVPTSPQTWRAWTIAPVGGGANNLLKPNKVEANKFMRQFE